MLALRQNMPGVKFILWCNTPDVQEMVGQHLRNNGVTYSAHLFDDAVVAEDKDCIVVHELFSGVNPWTRDVFFPATITGNECALLDTVDEDGSDQGWAKRLEKMNLASGLKFKILGPSDERSETLAMAGGDVLMDGKWVFLGKHNQTMDKLLRQHLPTAEIIVLDDKSNYEALYHTDLFLTLTGVLDNGRYVVLLGQCVALDAEFDGEAKRNNVYLDNMAHRLENDYPLKIIRNPLPMNNNLYSYNNCIVEVVQDRKTVWLPKYSYDAPQHETLGALEKENETIWRALGFNPCLVSATYSDLLGVKAGLHCITNELRA